MVEDRKHIRPTCQDSNLACLRGRQGRVRHRGTLALIMIPWAQIAPPEIFQEFSTLLRKAMLEFPLDTERQEEKMDLSHPVAVPQQPGPWMFNASSEHKDPFITYHSTGGGNEDDPFF